MTFRSSGSWRDSKAPVAQSRSHHRPAHPVAWLATSTAAAKAARSLDAGSGMTEFSNLLRGISTC
jgi:hypothetical protein